MRSLPIRPVTFTASLCLSRRSRIGLAQRGVALLQSICLCRRASRGFSECSIALLIGNSTLLNAR